jgi:hypothetical protein
VIRLIVQLLQAVHFFHAHLISYFCASSFVLMDACFLAKLFFIALDAVATGVVYLLLLFDSLKERFLASLRAYMAPMNPPYVEQQRQSRTCSTNTRIEVRRTRATYVYLSVRSLLRQRKVLKCPPISVIDCFCAL